MKTNRTTIDNNEANNEKQRNMEETILWTVEGTANQLMVSSKTVKRLIEEELVATTLSPPEPHTYKHRQGKLLVIAGSRGFTGAAVLSSNAAMRSGSGLVMCAVPESLNPVFERKLDEPMTLPIPDEGRGFHKTG